MRTCFLYLFLIPAVTALHAQKHSKQNLSETIVYRFDNRLLDVNALKMTDSSATLDYIELHHETLYTTFFGQKAADRRVLYKGVAFSLNDNRELILQNSQGDVLASIADPDKAIPLDHVSGNLALFAGPSGVVCVMRLSGGNGYRIRKYNEKGVCLNTWTVQHTLYKKEEKVVESMPYLYYMAHTTDKIVFSSLDHGIPSGTVLLDLKDGTTEKYPQSTVGIITDGNSHFEGRVYTDEKKLHVNLGVIHWSMDNTGSVNGVKTVLQDTILVVVRYNHIATGSSVDAYQANTGRHLWTGDVKQLNVGHSQYYNDVYLTLYKDKLILEGREAYGNYLQVLDLKTGRNLFSQMPGDSTH